MLTKTIQFSGVEFYSCEGETFAIVLPNKFHSTEINFFTPDNFSQQLGYLPHKAGNIIQPHLHNIVKREVYFTQEVLLIKKGKVKVNFYDNAKSYLDSIEITEGDVILLCSGGHGFEILEETVMIEIKQGPYLGIEDKTRFVGIEQPGVIK